MRSPPEGVEVPREAETTVPPEATTEVTPEPADLAPSPAAGEEEPSRPYVYEAFRPPAPIAETLSKVSGDGESALVPRISYDFNSPGGVDVYWDEFGEAKLVDGTYEVSVMPGVGQGALGGPEFGGSYAEFFPLVDIYLQIETWSHGLAHNASGLRFRE